MEIDSVNLVEHNEDASKSRKSIHVQAGWIERTSHYFKARLRDTRPFFCPVDYVHISRRDPDGSINYKLVHWYQRMFVTLHRPETAILGSIISGSIIFIILVNITVNIMMTLPEWRDVVPTTCPEPVCSNDPVLCPGTVKCEPVTSESLNTINEICVYLFTFEYLLRVLFCTTVPMRLSGTLQMNWNKEEVLLAKIESREPAQDPPNSGRIEICFAYAMRFRNLIDLVSVLPFFISLITQYNFGLSYIRILRVLRVLRASALVSKLGNPSDSVITMLIGVCASTKDVIFFILLIALLLVFIFGTILYDLEKGIYMINNDFPNGAWLRTNLDGSLELSPFQSTFSGMYWAITTMTTVGYGDMYPFSVGGKTIACLLMILGLLFMSLPIAIIGSKVTVEYDRMHKKAKELKQMKNLEHVERRVSRVSGISIEHLHEHSHSLLENVNSLEEPTKTVVEDAANGKCTKNCTDSHSSEVNVSCDVQQTSKISGISADLDSDDSELRAILRDFTALQQRLEVLCSKKQ